MSNLTDTRRALWLCIWPAENGAVRITLQIDVPDATGALAVLQVRGEIEGDGPVELNLDGTAT